MVRVATDDIAPLRVRPRGFEKYCGDAPLDIGLYRVDSESKGLADAFVIVDGPSEEFKADVPQVLDQASCVFKPPVLVIAPGELLLRNSDTIVHTSKIEAKINPSQDVLLAAGHSVAARLNFEEMIRVKCALHPWMHSVVIVTRRRTHALTDGAGRFLIQRVPAGRRRLRIWHVLGEEEVAMQIDVPADGTADAGVITWKPRAGFRAEFGR